MTVVKLVGDPEKVAASIQALISAGNTIYLLQKAKNNSSYLVIYGV